MGKVGPPGIYSQAVLSPDEKRVVLEVHTDPEKPTNSNLWLLDLSDGVYTRLTFDPSPEIDPVWSPDSRQIVYALLRPNLPELVQLTLGGAEQKKLYADGKASYVDDWSPDGKSLIYHESDNTTFDSLSMTGEHKPALLIHDAFHRDQMHFSPDGKWVAYNSDESGRLEVYVASFPKMDQKRQVSTGGGAEPMWRGDGKELYYLSLDNKLMAVSMTVGATLETGPPKDLFQTNVVNFYDDFGITAYNVSRDGKKFLLLEPVRSQAYSPERIHVIVNWDAALPKP